MLKLLKSLNQNVPTLKVIIFMTSLAPGLQLFYRYHSDQLGINGLETLLDTSGMSALWLYILTLAVTPLRRILSYICIQFRWLYGKRLGDWNWMVRVRRMLGVFAFLYGLFHFLIFFYFELDLGFAELLYEVDQRPFIIAGMLALILLLPLFLTSTDWSMRIFRKNWRRLHRLMYPVGLLVALHFLWLTKPGVYDAYPYAFVIILLLLFRVFNHYKIVFRREDDGMIAQR